MPPSPTTPKTKTPIIVLTGGGSGGHIAPLLPLARALKDLDPKCRVVYLGLKGDRLEGLQKRYAVFDEVYHITSGKFRRYHGESFLAHVKDIRTLALNIRDFFRVLSGVFAARRLLKKIKPDIVFSKGGFVVVPVGLAAKLLKIPIVTHDSDTLPGLANRIVGRWAKIHTTGMPPEFYNYPKETIHYIGIPLDERIKPVTDSLQRDYKQQLDMSPSSLVMLVGGSGLGAANINNLILEIAPGLLKELPDLHIIHIAGSSHQEQVEQKYEALLGSGAQKDRVRVLGFSDEFYKYTGAADLIISRAGATTIAELATARKACLLIPAPFLADGHQLKNAELLEKLGAAEIVPNDIEPEQLVHKIKQLLDDNRHRRTLAENLAKIARPEAAEKLAKLLLAATGKK